MTPEFQIQEEEEDIPETEDITEEDISEAIYVIEEVLDCIARCMACIYLVS